MAGYACNEELVKAFEDDEFKIKFQIYFGSLKKRFDAEVPRQRLREPY